MIGIEDVVIHLGGFAAGMGLAEILHRRVSPAVHPPLEPDASMTPPPRAPERGGGLRTAAAIQAELEALHEELNELHHREALEARGRAGGAERG